VSRRPKNQSAQANSDFPTSSTEVPKMKKKSKSTRRTITWRDYPDHLHRRFSQQPNPESLRPDHDTVLAAICGNPESRAIIDSYAFRFPVTVMAVQS
jgi:hypothetical protein